VPRIGVSSSERSNIRTRRSPQSSHDSASSDSLHTCEECLSPPASPGPGLIEDKYHDEKSRAKSPLKLHKAQSLNVLAAPFAPPFALPEDIRREVRRAVRRSSPAFPSQPRTCSSPLMQSQSNLEPSRAAAAAVNGVIAPGNGYDPFVAPSPALGVSGNLGQQVQPNPYSQDTTSIGGAAFYQGQGSFQQPVSQMDRHNLSVLIGYYSFNITSTPRSGLITRTSWRTSEMSTTSSFPMISAKRCRREPQHLFRYFQVGQRLILDACPGMPAR
jgi:hypothetical protein